MPINDTLEAVEFVTFIMDLLLMKNAVNQSSKTKRWPYALLLALFCAPCGQAAAMHLHGTKHIFSGNNKCDSFIGVRATESIEGSGLLEAPVIHIVAAKFAYTGTIRCTKECRIITRKAFNKNIFKQEGSGKFTFAVNPNLKI